MDTLTLTAYPDGQSQPTSYPLPLQRAGSHCFVELRNMRGASAIHVVLKGGESVRYRAEIPARGDESVRLEIVCDSDGNPLVRCQRPITLLPAQPSSKQSPPIYQDGNRQRDIDLALVIDGSSRIYAKGPQGTLVSSLLLADKERWQAHVDKLMRFVDGLTQDCGNPRVAVLSFGDQPVPDADAKDLKPLYRLEPEESTHALDRLNPAELQQRLLALRPTSGGDFVDALADALELCTRFSWRANARKLVLVSGDSPGHSLLHPVRKGGDASVRKHDVDTQSLRLYQNQVECLTLYHRPDAEYLQRLIGPAKEFQRYAESQYARLASLPEWAFTAEAFDGAAEAEKVLSVSGFIGYGACIGELVEIVPAD